MHGRWYGWDGAFDSLWSQALHPLRHPREMTGSAVQVQALLQADPALACRFQWVFGAALQANADPETTLMQAAKALGAFVGSLQSAPTPFDLFRGALAGGDARRAACYRCPPSAACVCSSAAASAAPATSAPTSAMAASPTSVRPSS